MPNDINELDVNDIGLKQIFGDRFHDIDDVTHVLEQHEDHCHNSAEEAAKSNKPLYAEWEPARPRPNFYDKLKRCAKSVAIFGGLNILVFYWQNSGLMADSIALPCMIVCAVLAGFGVGKAFGGK